MTPAVGARARRQHAVVGAVSAHQVERSAFVVGSVVASAGREAQVRDPRSVGRDVRAAVVMPALVGRESRET